MNDTGAERGFTLLEMMVTTAIVATLAGLATVGLMYGTGKARVNNAAFELVATVSMAQLRAASSGATNYVVVYENAAGKEFGFAHLERAGAPLKGSDFIGEPIANLYSLTSSGFLGTTVVSRRHLSDTRGVSFNDLGNFSATPPEPFAGIALTKRGTSGLLAACNFCAAGSGGNIGVLRISPDGVVTPLTQSTPTGVALAFAVQSDLGREQPNPRLILISAPAGAVKVFDRF